MYHLYTANISVYIVDIKADRHRALPPPDQLAIADGNMHDADAPASPPSSLHVPSARFEASPGSGQGSPGNPHQGSPGNPHAAATAAATDKGNDKGNGADGGADGGAGGNGSGKDGTDGTDAHNKDGTDGKDDPLAAIEKMGRDARVKRPAAAAAGHADGAPAMKRPATADSVMKRPAAAAAAARKPRMPKLEMGTTVKYAGGKINVSLGKEAFRVFLHENDVVDKLVRWSKYGGAASAWEASLKLIDGSS